MIRRTLIVAAALLALAAPAGAQELSKAAATAEQLAQQGKTLEALDAIETALATFREKSPVVFRKALFVAQPPDGYGIYNPRETNVFASGQEMLLYTEPVGFSWKQSGDVFQTDWIIDAVLKGLDGKVLWQQEGFGSMQLTSRVRNQEVMLKLNYTFTGLAAGDYLVETTLRDKVSGKKGTFTMPFKVSQ